MVSSFTGGLHMCVCDLIATTTSQLQPCFNLTFPHSLHCAVTHSFAFDSVRFPHLNTGWMTPVVFVLCWPGYTFITITETFKEVIVQVKASTVQLSGHLKALIIMCPDGMWLHKVWAPSQGVVIT